MKEFLRGVGAIAVMLLIVKACPDFAQTLPIAILAVVGWLRLFDLLWGVDGEKKDEV